MQKQAKQLLEIIALTVAVTALLGCTPAAAPKAELKQFPTLSGPYLGQQPPGMEPQLFAPGIVSTGLPTRDVAMTPDGNELYFGVFLGNRGLIMVTKLVDGHWTEPQVAPFCATNANDLEPHISPDGKRFYWLSCRPGEGQPAKPGWVYQDIWVMDREADGWGEPYNLGAPVNTDGAEFYPSVTRDGTLYFTRGEQSSAIYRSRQIDGIYQEPEKLPPQVNCGTGHFNAFIAPDESYIIVSVTGRDDSLGGPDYYIVFRSPDDSWSEPINMGATINTDRGGEWSPYLSPDGRYFFFMSSRRSEQLDGPLTGRSLTELLELHTAPQNGASDIYWVDAKIIATLRPAS